MTEQIHRTKINKFCSVIWLVYLRSVYLFCHLTCLSSLCVFVLAFDLIIFALCICSVIWLVYLRSVYLFCNLTCLSSLCVFGLSFDLFIFVLCICSVIWRAKINESNYRTNTQSKDKQVEWQTKYTEWR
jgi:hypothetical protein